MIIEYMMQRTDGGLITPNWVEDGGYFQKGKTFIGWGVEGAFRQYFMPEAVRELTQLELVERVKSLGLTKVDDSTHEEIALTDDEVEDLVDDWVSVRADRNIVLLEAARILYGDSYQDPASGSLYSGGEVLTPEQMQEVTTKAEELEEQVKVEKAYSSLRSACDAKSEDAKNYINGSKVTNEQVARYEEKYYMAKEFKANGSYAAQLQLEAELNGLTVDALADFIVAKGDEYKEALRVFNARIEAFRVKVQDLIDNGQVDKANDILEVAKGLDSSTTDEDIKALFEGL